MQKDTPYGVALLLAGIVLLAYGAVVFIGLSGVWGGRLVLPVVVVMTGVLMVFYGLIRLCKSKLGRSWREGWAGETAIGVAMLVVMMAGAAPVSNAIPMLEDGESGQADMDSLIVGLSEMPAAYGEYVDGRIRSFRAHLLSLTPGTEAYEQQLGHAPGDTKQEKARRVVESLHRRLMGQNMEACDSMRLAWLNSLATTERLSARAVAIVATTGTKWLAERQRLSAIEYKGEEHNPFAMPELEALLNRHATESYDLLHPTWKGLCAALASFVLVLLPYMMIRRSPRAKKGTHR